MAFIGGNPFSISLCNTGDNEGSVDIHTIIDRVYNFKGHKVLLSERKFEIYRRKTVTDYPVLNESCLTMIRFRSP